jgi:lactate dehydrogenase-like 2-hydroxyacid dehydrogenase
MINITFISNVTTPERAYSYVPEFKNCNVKFFTMADSAQKIISCAPNTQYIILDAMAKCGDDIISNLPNLKMIHSEGVGYQGVDLESAKRNNIIVCNNKGINDTAVAEHTVFLILACLKDIVNGQKSVYDGRQMQVKKESFGVVKELSECTVGLLGFGDIARATAKLLNAFGARVIYSNRTRYENLEGEYGVEYVTVDEMLQQSDFVSLHLAVCDDTREIVNEKFLSKMKKDSYLINTSRGDLVNNEALLNCLLNGEIAGAGLDVISPEPVESDNILLDERIANKLVLSPHIAGITSLTVKKLYKNSYENIMRVENGVKPLNIVKN